MSAMPMDPENDSSGWGIVRDIARDWFTHDLNKARIQQQAPYQVGANGVIYPLGTPSGASGAQVLNSLLPIFLLLGAGLIVYRMAK